MFFVWVAKAGALPFVVVLFFASHNSSRVLEQMRNSRQTIRSSRFCSFFFHWACYGGGFLGQLVFRLLLPFAACGPCEKGRKSEEKVGFRMNVTSAASSEGSLSNLSAFLCFRQCSLVKSSLRVCGSVCQEAASSPPLRRSFAGWSFLQSSRS
jgi:hypothetical protein